MALRVLIDGIPLAEPESRALWQRFSAWMEEHAGDLGGFARAEGFASVHPELHDGEPVLVASRSAPQGPYASAPARSGQSRSGPVASGPPAVPSPRKRRRG